MNSMWLIQASALTGFESLVKSRGGNPIALLRKQKLSVTTLRQSDVYIAQEKLASLLNQAAISLNQPLLGLQLAALQNAEVSGELAIASGQQATVSKMLQWANKHMQLYANGVHIKQRPDRSNSVWQLQFDYPYHAGLQQMLQLVVGQLANASISNLKLAGWKLHLRQSDPGTVVPLRFKNAVVLSSAFNGVQFPKSWSEQKFKASEAAMQNYFAQRTEELVARYPEALSSQVLQLINSLLATSECTLENVAASLDLQPRVLQKRLKLNGTNFRSLLQKTRKQTAIQQLSQTDNSLTVTELALSLGYAELASFSRNFKKWTGYSPQQFVKNRQTKSK